MIPQNLVDAGGGGSRAVELTPAVEPDREEVVQTPDPVATTTSIPSGIQNSGPSNSDTPAQAGGGSTTDQSNSDPVNVVPDPADPAPTTTDQDVDDIQNAGSAGSTESGFGAGSSTSGDNSGSGGNSGPGVTDSIGDDPVSPDTEPQNVPAPDSDPLPSPDDVTNALTAGLGLGAIVAAVLGVVLFIVGR